MTFRAHWTEEQKERERLRGRERYRRLAQDPEYRKRETKRLRRYREANAVMLRERRLQQYKALPPEKREALRERQKRWAKNNREKRRATSQRYRKRHPEKVRALAKIRRIEKRETLNARRLIYTRQGRKELSNLYLRKIIKQGTSLSSQDIPPSLLEAKREQIRLKRTLKKLKENPNEQASLQETRNPA